MNELRKRTVVIPDDWQPTVSNVNALPPALRRYIYELESRCGPVGPVAEDNRLRDEVEMAGGVRTIWWPRLRA